MPVLEEGEAEVVKRTRETAAKIAVDGHFSADLKSESGLQKVVCGLAIAGFQGLFDKELVT